MTTGNNHLLQKVTFEIGLASQDGAFEIQQRISNAFRSGIVRELEKLFDHRSNPDVMISIDKIELDLGRLSANHLEEEVISAFEREFGNFLETLTHEIAVAEVRAADNAKHINVKWSVAGNSGFEAHVIVSEKNVSRYNRIIEYLETGVLTGSVQEAGSVRISELMNNVLEHHGELFARFLKSQRQNSKVFQRLALNLKVPQLQYIVSLLGCPFSGELPDLTERLLRFLKEQQLQVSALRLPRGVSFHRLENFLWWLLLVRYSGALPVTQPATASALRTAEKFSPDAMTSLLVEILFLTERLSERSVLTATGKRKKDNRAYNSDNLLERALKIVTDQLLESSGKNKTAAEDKISQEKKNAAQQNAEEKKRGNQQGATEENAESHATVKDRSILSDSVSLAKNTLFTLPSDATSDLREAAAASESEAPGAETGIYVNNAGLILLTPYLKPFFTKLKLLDGKQFVAPEAAWKAIHLLQHACGFTNENKEEGAGESDLIFNKILCGVDITEPVPETMELTAEEKEETEHLLKAVIANWTIMSRSSVYALQSTFLQKNGRLSITGKDWSLVIERDSTVEILIDKLPWGISFIKLPWNSYSIHTTW
jgi:hypothetical protein